MRLKAYQAANMAEAMARIRAELGPDAVILGSEPQGNGVRVVAAWDGDSAGTPGALAEDVTDRLHELLDFHRVPASLTERLVGTALLAAPEGLVPALAVALESAFAFRSLGRTDDETAPVLLVGLPGHGKTVTAARFAARLVLSGQRVRVLVADNRAGAVAQIAELCKPMGLTVEPVADAETLARALAERVPGRVVIDGPALNPFDASDMALASELTQAARAEPVLIAAAGCAPEEATDVAAAFAALGVSRFVATRLDAARRLGDVLSLADAGLALADGGMGRTLADTLISMNPPALASLMAERAMRDAGRSREEAA